MIFHFKIPVSYVEGWKGRHSALLRHCFGLSLFESTEMGQFYKIAGNI